jgi:hypothetical protein
MYLPTCFKGLKSSNMSSSINMQINYTTYSHITSAALNFMQPSSSCHTYPFFIYFSLILSILQFEHQLPNQNLETISASSNWFKFFLSHRQSYFFLIKTFHHIIYDIVTLLSHVILGIYTTIHNQQQTLLSLIFLLLCDFRILLLASQGLCSME